LITVYNSDGAIENEVISDESGAWSLTLEPGEYTLFAVIDNVEYVYPVSLIRDHVYVDFMR
jgi:tetrahydromethanopterin S-methyltransferase subunit H